MLNNILRYVWAKKFQKTGGREQRRIMKEILCNDFDELSHKKSGICVKKCLAERNHATTH